MEQPTYHAVDGLTIMYDIIVDGEVVGIVWQMGGRWNADRSSMAAPAVTGETREEAAEKLISV